MPQNKSEKVVMSLDCFINGLEFVNFAEFSEIVSLRLSMNLGILLVVISYMLRKLTRNFEINSNVLDLQNGLFRRM